jgi:competence protein ComEA
VQTNKRWTVAAAILCVGLIAPAQSHDPSRVPKTSTAAPAPEQRLDINHASLAELLKVPGLTRGWAERIVRYRPYRTKHDLIDKGVLSNEVYDRIKDYVIAHRDN